MDKLFTYFIKLHINKNKVFSNDFCNTELSIQTINLNAKDITKRISKVIENECLNIVKEQLQEYELQKGHIL